MSRENSHGNAKLKRIADLCKVVQQMINYTELDYKDPALQAVMGELDQELNMIKPMPEGS